jgi:hypothetical protein
MSRMHMAMAPNDIAHMVPSGITEWLKDIAKILGDINITDKTKLKNQADQY